MVAWDRRRVWVRSVWVAVALCAGIASGAQGQGRNIVFFLVDDQRYDALSLYNEYWNTPHIDELAANGILFENAFVTTSLCSPSRASILSGRYAHAHGVLDNGTRFPAEIPTFPNRMQAAGYDTAFIGKWHMGGSSDEPRPGFDRWVSFRGQGAYNNQTFNVDGERVRREGYTTDIITEYAEEFLRGERDGPFLLYVSHKAVHAPFTPADRHKGEYDDREYPYPATMANTAENYEGKPAWVREQRQSWHGVDGLYNKTTTMDRFVREYAEALRAVDDSVGRLASVLRERGMLESALFVFTSDNGFQFGEHGLIDKRTMYAASIRVPLIVHCPDLFDGGQRRDEMILNVDYAPTFLEAAGLDVPAGVQGMSFYGLLTGERSDWREAFLYEYFWERSFPQTPTVLGVRTDRHKYMKFHGIWDKYELYDMQADPHETNNLLGAFELGNLPGQLERHIRRQAQEPVKSVFITMEEHLGRLLEELGVAPEPNWLPLDR